MVLGLVFYFNFLILLSSCSTASVKVTQKIANPFSEQVEYSKINGPPKILLRSKNKDQSVEVEIPGALNEVSDFVIPIPADSADGAYRSIASEKNIDESYKDENMGFTDKELVASFEQPSFLDPKRKLIEDQLNLMSENVSMDDKKSYLASVDKIKQLFKLARYEAALLEIDKLLKLYPTDAQLYKMRGTLFSRIGRPELAMRSWSQALEFNPDNKELRKFLDQNLRQNGRLP